MRAAQDAREWIAKVVAQHRYKLLAERRGGAFVKQHRVLGCAQRLEFPCGLFSDGSRFDQLPLIATAVGGVEDRQPREEMTPLSIALLLRVNQHGQTDPLLGHEIEGDLVEKSLHAQQRREMRLEENAARDMQQIVQAPADQLLAGIAY